MTGSPGKEQGTNNYQPEEFRKSQKVTPRVQPPPRILLAGIHLGWTRRAPPGRTLSQNDWLDSPETNPITIKPKTASHVAEQFSWVPLPYCFLWAHFPNKISSFVSTCVSLDNSFLSVRQEPTFRPQKGSPFLQQHQNLKASILWSSAFFMVQLSHLYMTTGKIIALSIWTFVGKVMSLLFNMLSRLVIAFLQMSKCLLIS